MTDIVERLRSRMPSVPAMLDAADEIVRLRESVRIRDEEIERLRFYCEEWARDAGVPCPYCGNDHTPEHPVCLKQRRDALDEKIAGF